MNTDQLKIKLGQLELQFPLMNAAGTCKSLEDVRKLAEQAEIGAVTVGSITLLPRDGNAGDVFEVRDGYSLNALGMPNRGAEYYTEVLPAMVDMAHAHGKPLIVSVAGFTPDEYAKLAKIAFDGGADAVKLNLGCPNVRDGGQQHPIMSFSPPAIRATLTQVHDAVGVDRVVGLKCSPFSNPLDLVRVAEVVNDFPWVTYVATTNSFPNTVLLNPDGKPCLSTTFGGLAGPAMKPIGLGQVMQWRKLLSPHIHVIGVGGVATGQDLLDYKRAGATACQVATAYLRQEDPRVFGQILAEYLELMPCEYIEFMP